MSKEILTDPISPTFIKHRQDSNLAEIEPGRTTTAVTRTQAEMEKAKEKRRNSSKTNNIAK